jgi:hypothetical protein
MGHLTINIPAASAKSLSGARGFTFAPTDVPAIRIYILLNGSFIKASSSQDYFQSNLTVSNGGAGSNTITIDLAPSSGYQVLATLGSAPASGGWKPEYYGSTSTFTITAGAITQQDLVANSIPFDPTLTAASSTPAYVALANGSLYQILNGAVTGNGVSVPINGHFSKVSSFSAGQWFSSSDPSGFAPEVWINTDNGLFTLSGSYLLQRSSTLGVNAIGAGAVVADVTTADGTTLPNSLIAFSFGSDLLYAFSNNQSATSTAAFDPANMGSLSAYLASNPTLQNSLPNPGTFLKAFAVVLGSSPPATTYGFAATALGCFMYNQTVQGLIGSDPKTWILNQLQPGGSTAADTITASSGASPLLITSLALDDPAVPNYVYAGTSAGLFDSQIVAGVPQVPNNALNQVASSAVVKLTAATIGGASYAAFIDGQGNLVVMQGGSQILSYPFYSFSGTPSAVTSLTFYQDSGALKLAVASTDSLAVLTVVPATTR